MLFPSPRNLPNPGIEPGSPTLQADALTSEPPGKPLMHITGLFNIMLIIKQNSFLKDSMQKRHMERTVGMCGWDETKLSQSNDYLEKILQTES